MILFFNRQISCFFEEESFPKLQTSVSDQIKELKASRIRNEEATERCIQETRKFEEQKSERYGCHGHPKKYISNPLKKEEIAAGVTGEC